MKIKALLPSLPYDFINEYLSACGVKDTALYRNPNASCFDNPYDYINMNNAAMMFGSYIEHHEVGDVCIVIDSDLDGVCSAALQYMYLTGLGCNVKVLYHTAKQHGLDDVLQQVLDSGCGLCWIADAGTNDMESCRALHEHGIEVLCTDHHNVLCDNPYAYVINNQLGNVNKELSGAGVTYQFIKAMGGLCTEDNNYQYMDIVALSVIGDMCDLTSLENRAFVCYGLNNITNPFVQLLFDKQCKRRGKTPEAVSWDIAPLANALARMDDQDSKMLFFDALVGNIDLNEALDKIKHIKRIQDATVKSVVDEIEPSLDNTHKAIIGFTEAENKGFIGLIANKFTGKYNKPTILLREKDTTTWSGSLRSPIPLLEQINESKLAECSGHGSACGIQVKKCNLTKLARWLDTLDLDVEPDIEVTASIKYNDITIPLCEACENGKDIWGMGIPQPTFHITLHSPASYIFKKSITTIKLVDNNISFLLFFAKNSDVEQLSNCDGKDIDVIFTLGINEYNGVISPQCNIKQYEVHSNEEEFNWEDVFK